jgi:5'-nucleotidase
MDKERAVALVDMDGTLCDYHKALEEDIQFVLEGEQVSQRLRRKLELVIRHQIGWFEKLEKIPLGFDIVHCLRQIGFKIVILTKGNTKLVNCWSEKVVWCKRNIPTASITITEDKGLVYGRILVDDFPPYIERWLAWRPRGLVLLPDHPWNRDLKHPNVIRIKDEGDIETARPRILAAYERQPKEQGD